MRKFDLYNFFKIGSRFSVSIKWMMTAHFHFNSHTRSCSHIIKRRKIHESGSRNLRINYFLNINSKKKNHKVTYFHSNRILMWTKTLAKEVLKNKKYESKLMPHFWAYVRSKSYFFSKYEVIGGDEGGGGFAWFPNH